MEIPNNIKNVVSLLSNDLSIMEIWLIGSRASGQANDKSDWDLLVFSTSEPQPTDSRFDGIDILWKGPSGEVLLEGQETFFQFSFSDFNWLVTGRNHATYRGRKFNELSDGVRDGSSPLQSFTEGKGICIWRRQ